MNIGLFTDAYYPLINGVTVSTQTLADFLTARGHNVYIFAPDSPKKPKGEKNVIRMPSLPINMVKNARVGLAYSPTALKKIVSLKLDIIHTQTEFPLGIFGKVFSKTMNIPLVHTYHTMYEDYVHYIAHGHIVKPGFAKKYSEIFCNYANAVVAPTEKTKRYLLSYGVRKKISVIPSGIDLAHFRRSNFTREEILALRKTYGLAPDTPVILSLGRVAKEKSIDVVIDAMPALLDKLPEARLVIVGDGPVMGNLKKQAENLKIEDKIIFTGGKSFQEIGKYYQLGNVFVSASVTETQGLTFAESMAAGIPVVAKNDPSIKGIVKEGETGLLFEKPEELSQLLYTLLTDQKKQEELSQNGISFIEGLSAESFAEHIEKLYQDILTNPASYGFHRRKMHPFIQLKMAEHKLIALSLLLRCKVCGEKARLKRLAKKAQKKFMIKK